MFFKNIFKRQKINKYNPTKLKFKIKLNRRMGFRRILQGNQFINKQPKPD